MPRPIIGIIGNTHMITDTYHVHAAGFHSSLAISKVADCTPLIVPTDPQLVSVEELMEQCDGFLFTGARPNVHPKYYGEEPTAAHGDFDIARDEITLPLIRALTERGSPIAVFVVAFKRSALPLVARFIRKSVTCRGGLTPHAADGTQEEIFELRQRVTFTEGGPWHALMGAREVMTNTLHGQGVLNPGDGVVIDGVADDTTPEALYIQDAPGFTLSAQWHPEFDAPNDPVSIKLFSAFGKATRAWSERSRPTIASAFAAG